MIIPLGINVPPPGTSPWKAIGAADDPESVWGAIKALLLRIDPGHDLTVVRCVFDFVVAIFDGRIAGYRPLRTPYHNRTHTLEVVVCAARLLHGMHVAGVAVDARMIDSVITGALFHDTGYVLKDEEAEGTGAQFTEQHVARSVEIAKKHFGRVSRGLMHSVCIAIQATDHRLAPDDLGDMSDEQRLAAQLLATADIVGQMASRDYLERLLFLYFEFREAGMGDYADMNDLLEKTIGFYSLTRKRLCAQLGGLVDYLALHFRDAQSVERNFYLESIDQNIAYLKTVLARDRSERLNHLKRSGIVEQIRRMA